MIVYYYPLLYIYVHYPVLYTVCYIMFVTYKLFKTMLIRESKQCKSLMQITIF